MATGQFGTWGQFGTRDNLGAGTIYGTIWGPAQFMGKFGKIWQRDNLETGQFGTWGQFGTEKIWHQDNLALIQFGVVCNVAFLSQICKTLPLFVVKR